MASNTTMIRKLQTAINVHGGRIMYSTSQFYSKQQDRPVTIYTVKEAVYDKEKDKYQNVELYSSTSQIQIVLFLRDYWFTMNGWELPQDNEKWNEKKAKAKEEKEKDTA